MMLHCQTSTDRVISETALNRMLPSKGTNTCYHVLVNKWEGGEMLDSLDQKLIQELQENGRQSNTDLAKMLDPRHSFC